MGFSRGPLASLRVQASWINDSEFIGYFVAMAKGYYQDVGLEIVHMPGHAGLVPERALIQGTADLALTSPDSLASTIASTGETRFRIIGAQFQKNPLGIVSLAAAPIRGLADLHGRTLAVPDMNRAMVLDLLERNGVNPAGFAIVPYNHDVAPLVEGRTDAFVDFIVDGQFKLQQLGFAPHAVLLHDFGATLFNNVVVVRKDDVERRRDFLVSWLVASQRGWEENARDLTRYPKELRVGWLDESRSVEQETFANSIFAPLVSSDRGIFAMSAEQIALNLSYLKLLGTPLAPDIFDVTLLGAADERRLAQSET